jgi:hypothetical protein
VADIFDGAELSPEQQREIDTLRRVNAFANSLTADPKIGLALRRRLRELNPDAKVAIPEDDIAEPLLAPIREELTQLKGNHEETLKAIDEKKSAIDKVIEDFRTEQKDTREVGDLKRKIDAAAAKYRFTDEGRAALIEHMKATNTSDPDTAGAYLVQHMDKPAPVTSNGLAPEQARRNGAPDIDLFQLATGETDDTMKLLHSPNPKDRDRWMMGQIDNIIAEGADAA